MQYVTKAEAVATRVKENLQSVAVNRLTPVEEKLVEVINLKKLPFSTQQEKNAKQKAVEVYINELNIISNGNEKLAERVRSGVFSDKKFDELMGYYPRVEAVIFQNQPKSVFTLMHMNSVPFGAVERSARFLIGLAEICKLLPMVSAYVMTPRSWPIRVFRQKAESEKNPAYYGVTLPEEMQQKVDSIVNDTPYPILSYGLINVPLDEICRRVRLTAPEGVTFKKREAYTPHTTTILDVIRKNGDQEVVNSFIIE